MIYLQLFISFFKVGLFGFGGGYAALPLIQHQVVDVHSWLTVAEFSNIVSVAGIVPGVIGINSSVLVGMQTAGFGGAIVATLGYITPSCIIIFTLSHFYNKYKNTYMINNILQNIKPASVALITSAGVSIIITAFWGSSGFSLDISAIDYISVAIFIVGLIVIKKFRVNPIFIILGSGLVCLLISLIISYV